MRIIFLLSFIYLTLSCSSLQKEISNYRLPAESVRSDLLRDIILNESINTALVKDVGTRCSKALIDVYRQGKTLKSRFIEKNLIDLNSPASKNCDKYNNLPLYHYTSSKYVIDNFANLSNRNYSELISYGRSKDNGKPIISINGFSSAIVGVLYVAMYPNTSSGYGDHLLTLWAKKDLKVVSRRIFDHFYRFGLVGATSPELKTILKDLPPNVTENCNIADIALFILEDSGADLVDYIPSYSTPETRYNEKGWFYLLNSKSIEAHSLINFSNSNSDENQIEEKFKSEGRECETRR